MNKDKANAIAQTVNTPGWSFLKEFMNEAFIKAQETLVDMDDSERAEKLRLGLKYARQWRDAFIRKAESLAVYDEESIDDFGGMNFEEMLAAKQKEMESGRASN